MNIGYAVILGIIQGLTEFLPVSSSGHLVIAQHFVPGFHQPRLLFDVILHMGTLTAVVFFMRRDIYSLVCALLPQSRRRTSPGGGGACNAYASRMMILNVVIATVVTGALAITFKDEVEQLFSSPVLASFMLLVTGSLLFAAEVVRKADRGRESITIKNSIIIGLAQALAVIPGISRSGATISFGIFQGVSAEGAARFSFLISIPAVLGALILQARHVSLVATPDMPFYAAGFAAAVITGFLSLKLLFLMIKKWRLTFFSYYCWFMGGAILLLMGLKY